MSVQAIDLAPEFRGMPFIVRIQELNPLPLGDANPGVTRRTHPPVLLVDHAYAIAENRQNLRRAILRAIVNHDHLEVLERLGQDAVNRSSNAIRAIERGNNNGDGWYGHV
jgi:hypothetical protein